MYVLTYQFKGSEHEWTDAFISKQASIHVYEQNIELVRKHKGWCTRIVECNAAAHAQAFLRAMKSFLQTYRLVDIDILTGKQRLIAVNVTPDATVPSQ